LLVFVSVGVPLGCSLAIGAFGIPVSDDWAYSRVAQHFFETGQFHLVGWGSMFLAGHILWAWPFQAALGNGIEALHVSVVGAAALALASAYFIARSLLPARRAALACATLAVFPGFSLLAVSFMTDVTALAAQFGSLALGLAALCQRERRRTYLFIGAAAVGIWGFTVRETCLIAPLAVLLAGVVDARARQQRSRARLFAMSGVALVMGCAAAFAWRHTWPRDQTAAAGSFLGQGLRGVAFDSGRAIVTLALALTPIVVLGMARVRYSRRTVISAIIGLGFSLLVALYAHSHGSAVLLGNMLTRHGNGGSQAWGVRPNFLPAGLWDAVSALGLMSTIGLIVVLTCFGGQLRRRNVAVALRDPALVLMLVFTLGSAVLMVVTSIASGALYDRYLLPLSFSVAVLILRGAPAPSFARFTIGPPLIALFLLWALSIALTLNSLVYVHARWDAGLSLERGGRAATAIDAGFEWSGFHSRAVTDSRQFERTESGVPFYDRMFTDESSCVRVADSLLREATQSKRYYRDWLGRTQTLYVYSACS
jgi:hypothetical protein